MCDAHALAQWRRWKREKAADGGEAVVTAPKAAAVRAIAAPPAAAAVPAAAAPTAASSKGKEEAAVRSSAVAVPKAAAPAAAAPAAAAQGQVSVPRVAAAEGGDKEAVALQSAGEKWVAEFNAASDKQKKQLRNEVTEATKALLRAGHYATMEGAPQVEVDVVGAEAGRTVYAGEESFPKPSAAFNTTAHFVKSDAIDTALFLIEKKGVNPLLVIPVDPKNPGEGFPGTGSLEEQAYRRSTLWAAIDGEGKGGDFKYQVRKHAWRSPRVASPLIHHPLLADPREGWHLPALGAGVPRLRDQERLPVLEGPAQACLFLGLLGAQAQARVQGQERDSGRRG